jgi:hypothetical protein
MKLSSTASTCFSSSDASTGTTAFLLSLALGVGDSATDAGASVATAIVETDGTQVRLLQIDSQVVWLLQTDSATLASAMAVRQPQRPLFCGEIWLPRPRCAGWIWIWAEPWFEVLWIGEWGSVVAAAAVEVKPKEMADGKLPYHHARVLVGWHPQPSQW